MVCGSCFTGAHAQCNGFLKTSLAFCDCADRQHTPAPLSEDEQTIRQRNDAIVTAYVSRWFKQTEAR